MHALLPPLLFVFLSVYFSPSTLSVCLFVYSSACFLPLYVLVSAKVLASHDHPARYLSLYLIICLLTSLSASLLAYLPTCLPTCLCATLLACYPAYLPLCMSVYSPV